MNYFSRFVSFLILVLLVVNSTGCAKDAHDLLHEMEHEGEIDSIILPISQIDSTNCKIEFQDITQEEYEIAKEYALSLKGKRENDVAPSSTATTDSTLGSSQNQNKYPYKYREYYLHYEVGNDQLPCTLTLAYIAKFIENKAEESHSDGEIVEMISKSSFVSPKEEYLKWNEILNDAIVLDTKAPRNTLQIMVSGTLTVTFSDRSFNPVINPTDFIEVAPEKMDQNSYKKMININHSIALDFS